ncbi:hypothetical protein BDN72DRAFT_963245 [Pluteus cervinus]|uniref:Uncharacterized protein n=1 Tax=Pluteus cervinus TaxID=181527 RepID=A0ACD3AFD7_9AGAR|nr:hypothetical protein BDN72DRAFT_963245 [Pluteus cervinus]
MISVSSTDLPTEVILKILEDVRQPVLPNSETGLYNDTFPASIDVLAKLRLINWAWYHCVTPMLYSTLVIPCSDGLGLERRLGAIKYHPQLVETLIFEGYPSDQNSDLRKRLPHYLVGCLVECTNLQELNFNRAQLVLGILSTSTIERFLRNSVQRPIPALTFRVGGLRGAVRSFELIRAMGDNFKQLRELNLSSTAGIRFSRKFPFPRQLPSLERLTLRGLRHRVMKKVLSRIFIKVLPEELVGSSSNLTDLPRRPATSIISPLRHLTMGQIPDLRRDLPIVDLLSVNNLGSSLTSLHLTRLRTYPLYDEASLDALPTQIFRVCPRLKEFIFFMPCTQTSIRNLPPDLEVLGVLLTDKNETKFPLTSPLTITDFEPLVQLVIDTVRRRSLKKLCIGLRGNGKLIEGELDALRDSSLNAGLAFDIQVGKFW